MEELFKQDEAPWNWECFQKYFDNHIKADVVHAAGRWVIEPMGLYDEISGITSNAAETLNSILKNQKTVKDMLQPSQVIMSLKVFNDE